MPTRIARAFFALALLTLGACAAHAPSEPAEKGIVVFRVEPGDAEVWIDGEHKGAASDFDGRLEVLELGAGTHKVELRLAGYGTHSAEISLGAGAKQTIEVTLDKAGQEE